MINVGRNGKIDKIFAFDNSKRPFFYVHSPRAALISTLHIILILYCQVPDFLINFTEIKKKALSLRSSCFKVTMLLKKTNISFFSVFFSARKRFWYGSYFMNSVSLKKNCNIVFIVYSMDI